MSDEREEAKTRASNRRTIVIIGLIVLGFAVPALVRIGQYLIGLL